MQATILNKLVLKLLQENLTLLKEFSVDNLTLAQKIKIQSLTSSSKKLTIFIKKIIEASNIKNTMPNPLKSSYNKKLSLSVLLVEDEPIIQRTHRFMLEQLGYKVELAETGQQAIAKSYQKPDVILMDVGLPDIDGIEVTQKIRALKDNPEVANVPIIILSAYSKEEIRAKCLNIGVNDFSSKPISPLALLEVIENVISMDNRE